MKGEIERKTKDYKNKYENMYEMIKTEKRQEIDRLEEDYKTKLSSMTYKYKESLEEQTQRFNSYFLFFFIFYLLLVNYQSRMRKIE